MFLYKNLKSLHKFTCPNCKSSCKRISKGTVSTKYQCSCENLSIFHYHDYKSKSLFIASFFIDGLQLEISCKYLPNNRHQYLTRLYSCNSQFSLIHFSETFPKVFYNNDYNQIVNYFQSISIFS